jgi:hypothetical protein
VDTDKWKSVAVSIDIYRMLKAMAEKSDRSVSKQVAHIVKKEYQAGKKLSA